MHNFGEDACEDCGCDICRCPDDWLIQNEYETEVNFTVEQSDYEESKKERLLKMFREWQKADYEELDLLRTFLIVKGLEEEFDKWVSERLEND